MTNGNLKAAAVERIAIDILEAEGYNVHRTVRTSAWRDGRWISNANDVFGCVDLVAKRAPRPDQPNRNRWVQVTCSGGIGEKIADLSTVPWDTAIDSVEIWRWVDGTGKHTDGRNGLPRDRLYFQVYLLDDGYQLVKERRIRRMQPVAKQPLPESG